MGYSGKTILVVGASGVLGHGLAERFAAQGARVLATASSNESAAKLPASAALSLLLDLESAESIRVLGQYLTASEKLDGVVLASGRVGFGAIDATTAEQAKRLMQINFLGLAELLTAIKPALNDGGFVAAITGVVAEKAFPGMAAYCASKSALSAWLSAAQFELKKQGVSTVELRPGHTETGLATRPLFGAAPQMPTGMTADHVVERIMSAIESRTSVVSSGDFSN